MVYVLLADGFEEIEALTPVDILRRAGIEVKTVSIKHRTVTGAHNISVIADALITELENADDMELLMLPGGAGHELLDASNDVHGLINLAHERGIYIAAICAAPSIIGKKMLLDGKKATCFPGYEKYLHGAEITGEKVTVDGKFITGRGAGAASEFGFAICEILKDRSTADSLRISMQY